MAVLISDVIKRLHSDKEFEDRSSQGPPVDSFRVALRLSSWLRQHHQHLGGHVSHCPHNTLTSSIIRACRGQVIEIAKLIPRRAAIVLGEYLRLVKEKIGSGPDIPVPRSPPRCTPRVSSPHSRSRCPCQRYEHGRRHPKGYSGAKKTSQIETKDVPYLEVPVHESQLMHVIQCEGTLSGIKDHSLLWQTVGGRSFNRLVEVSG